MHGRFSIIWGARTRVSSQSLRLCVLVYRYELSMVTTYSQKDSEVPLILGLGICIQKKEMMLTKLCLFLYQRLYNHHNQEPWMSDAIFTKLSQLFLSIAAWLSSSGPYTGCIIIWLRLGDLRRSRFFKY